MLICLPAALTPNGCAPEPTLAARGGAKWSSMVPSAPGNRDKAAGTTVVPVNPAAGSRELEHIVGDSEPELLLARGDVELPEGLRALLQVDVREVKRRD